MISKKDILRIKELFDDSFQTGFSQVKELFGNEVRKYKNEIITRLDQALKELKAVREEQAVQSGYKDQLEEHEKRISKLEQVMSS